MRSRRLARKRPQATREPQAPQVKMKPLITRNSDTPEWPSISTAAGRLSARGQKPNSSGWPCTREVESQWKPW